MRTVKVLSNNFNLQPINSTVYWEKNQDIQVV